MLKQKKATKIFNTNSLLTPLNTTLPIESQLQENLLLAQEEEQYLKAVQQFQSLFNQNKNYNQMLDKERRRKQQNKETLQELKKRILYLSSADQENKRNGKNIASETQKLKENFTLNKILMMERVVKLQRETDDYRQRKENYIRLRNERELRSEQKKERSLQYRENMRLKSMNQSRNLRIELSNKKLSQLENSRQVVRSVKSEKDRLRRKTMKIQAYKRERAFNNYLQKILQEKQKIQQREMMLEKLSIPETKNPKPIKAPPQVAKPVKTHEGQIFSFFTTEANSLDQR